LIADSNFDRKKERKREKVARNVFIAVPAAVERDRFRTDARQWGLQEIPAKTQSL
jgi:hypothetical protein